jgi:benzylsuccinate synthase
LFGTIIVTHQQKGELIMASCENCTFYFQIPNDADDYEPGKGDCVIENRDEKGKYWLSKPVFNAMDACEKFNKKQI